MSVIAAKRYRDGKAVGDVVLGHKPEVWPPARNEFVWIGLFEPSSEELQTVANCFGLHPLAVEDAQMQRQLPKAEHYGDQLFVVLRTAHLDGDAICYGQTAIFMGQGFIVTVRQGSARKHSNLRAHLEAAPAALAHGPDYVLHSIMDFIVDGYFPIVEQLEEEALAMETEASDHFLDRESILRIFTMRREVVRFQRVMGVMIDVSARLANVSMPQIDADMRPYFRDVYDHVHRAEYRLGGLRDILTSVVETSNLLEMQRQGDNTRRLAAWAGLLAVPTAIAGIYGMNFKFMPELDWRYGYDMALALMAGICVILYWRFRKSGWL